MRSRNAGDEIPEDLRKYLCEHPSKHLELNPEKRDYVNVENVRLKRIDDLQITEVPLDSSDYALNWKSHGLDQSTEELKKVDLCYKFRVVDVIAEEMDGRFDHYGLFSWFCDLNRYGTWDETHYLIYTFPETTWSYVIKNPMKYFNAQWEPENVVCELLVPWAEQHLGVDMKPFQLNESERSSEPWW